MLTVANAADEPLPVLQLQLEAVDAQYDAVKRFEYVPKGDDMEVWMIGSKYRVGSYKNKIAMPEQMNMLKVLMMVVGILMKDIVPQKQINGCLTEQQEIFPG